MTGNRLIERRAEAAGSAKTEHCPYGYDSPHQWCAWRNEQANVMKSGLIWIVGPSGTPILVDDEQVSAERHARERRQQEEERKRFNWRQMHPVTEGQAA